jgi:tRNA U55 pseudouridine synthase TruB
VERTAVPVSVHALDVLAVEGDRVELEVRCSAGTYVRSLARDLGDALGTGAHLAALRRIEAGGFGLADAVAWDAVLAGAAARLLPLGQALPHLPAVHVGEEGALAVRHGRDLDHRLVLDHFPDDPPPRRLRVLVQAGHLLALVVPRGFAVSAPGLPVPRVLHPDVVLTD